MQECLNLLDFENAAKISICLQISTSIQPTTSPEEFVVRLGLTSIDLVSFLSEVQSWGLRTLAALAQNEDIALLIAQHRGTLSVKQVFRCVHLLVLYVFQQWV